MKINTKMSFQQQEDFFFFDLFFNWELPSLLEPI